MALNEYEIYNMKHRRGSFMQSLSWGEVKSNWKSEILTVNDKSGNITAGAQVLVRKIPLVPFTFMYIPRGPLWDRDKPEALKKLFERICISARRHRAFALRLDPQIEDADFESIELLKSLGLEYHPERIGYENTQCRENYILKIGGRSAEAIFESFKPKCRYNIRLSKRKGVECYFCSEEKFEDFYRLLTETAERDGFEIRSGEYYKRLLRIFGEKARLCMCYKEDKALSGAIYVEYGNRATYLVGASSNENRNLMPNYLMQWTMIEKAAKSNLEIYDFGGIPYYRDEAHKNYGVYRFKRQFSGEVVNFAGEFDIVFSKWFYKIGRYFI